MTSVSDRPSEILPLAGLRILVTRQDTPESSLSEMLKTQGASVITTPMTMIMPPASWELFDKTVQQAADIEWAVFTSSNGVRHCLSRLKELGLSPKIIFSTLKIACVGQSTASTLAEKGIFPELVPEHYQSEGLLSAFKQYDLKHKKCWLIQAESPREILANALEKQEAQIVSTPVYRNVPAQSDTTLLQKELEQNQLDWILFASPSAVQNFQRIIPAGFWLSLTIAPKIACLGEITAATVQTYGWEVHAKPEIQDFEHLVQIICEINLKKTEKR
jgi:uroporphyrinogen III methyltransferase/synthase